MLSSIRFINQRLHFFHTVSFAWNGHTRSRLAEDALRFMSSPSPTCRGLSQFAKIAMQNHRAARGCQGALGTPYTLLLCSRVFAIWYYGQHTLR